MAELAYTYEITNEDGGTECMIHVLEDGTYLFDQYPTAPTKEDLDSYLTSCQTAIARLQRHDLIKLEVIKVI